MRGLLFGLAMGAASAIRLSRTLGDHSVLQRDKPAPVWGFDSPGSTVSTAFAGVKLSTVTGRDGIWRVVLPPTPAGGPYSLTFTSSVGGSVSMSDVLLGDVYLCGGQSNMQFTVASGLNASAEIAAANYPNIRVFTVGQGNSSNTPFTDLGSVEQNWTAATPQSIGGPEWDEFSAICWFFGRNVYNALGGSVPIGLISNNWGGTCLSQWSTAAVNQACGTNGQGSLYNAMIAPYITGPMALTGFLWSQGECDADHNNTAFYNCAFGPFIDDWRKSFNAPNAFFGFELLPAYIQDSTFSPASLPWERAAQLTGLTRGPTVVTANGMDLGDPKAPHGSVHPRNKQTVAERFTAAALNVVYGRPVSYRNPAYASAAAVTSGTSVSVTVFFDQATLGSSGLTIVPSACPTDLGVPLAECSWHEVQTVDGAWYNATAAVGKDGTTLQLSVTLPSPGGIAVNATRSSWSPYPVPTLFTADAHLPALPWFAKVDSAVVQ